MAVMEVSDSEGHDSVRAGILDSGQSTRDTSRGRTGERAKNENKEKKLNPCYTEIQTRASQS